MDKTYITIAGGIISLLLAVVGFLLKAIYRRLESHEAYGERIATLEAQSQNSKEAWQRIESKLDDLIKCLSNKDHK